MSESPETRRRSSNTPSHHSLTISLINLQFIFDAVGEHCIPVGTHRHGCCVLQRCIDHASGVQKIQLIQKITAHSIELVQDAFGNYVVQYILDLGEPKLSEPVILQFRGMICDLAKQKFSSNVMEKVRSPKRRTYSSNTDRLSVFVSQSHLQRRFSSRKSSPLAALRIC